MQKWVHRLYMHTQKVIKEEYINNSKNVTDCKRLLLTNVTDEYRSLDKLSF